MGELPACHAVMVELPARMSAEQQLQEKLGSRRAKLRDYLNLDHSTKLPLGPAD